MHRLMFYILEKPEETFLILDTQTTIRVYLGFQLLYLDMGDFLTDPCNNSSELQPFPKHTIELLATLRDNFLKLHKLFMNYK